MQYYLCKKLHLLCSLSWLACPALNFHSAGEKKKKQTTRLLSRAVLASANWANPPLWGRTWAEAAVWIFPELKYFSWKTSNNICSASWKANVGLALHIIQIWACTSVEEASMWYTILKGVGGEQSLAIKSAPADRNQYFLQNSSGTIRKVTIQISSV